jgi:hypothetical protein
MQRPAKAIHRPSQNQTYIRSRHAIDELPEFRLTLRISLLSAVAVCKRGDDLATAPACEIQKVIHLRSKRLARRELSIQGTRFRHGPHPI